MSNMNDSGSSGLSDWALVNSQGELEGSDGDSNSSSIEVMEVEGAAPEAGGQTGDHSNPGLRDSSPECIELEQLMKAADEAAGEGPQEGVESSQHLEETLEIAQASGACCSELLQEREGKSLHSELDKEAFSDNCSTCTSSASGDSVTTSSPESISSLSESVSGSRSTKSDSDNESDFVRLEKDSSSTNITESEGEELQGESEAVTRSRFNLSTSGSSVGSSFNFLAGSRASLTPPPVVVLPPLAEQLPPPPLPLPSPPVAPPQLPLLVNNQADDPDDADTESATEQDEDDRIESEQSDDANSAPPDEQDQADLSTMSDIGDLPLVPGAVERHYIHQDNLQLNLKLNCIVVTVILVVFGLGLGHWIGSAREHFSQMEIQLAQMQKLHEMQDEYVQCLSHNDELLISSEQILQNERDRHQEAMADLRDNNYKLQEQLQDAQDQLEAFLSRKHHHLPSTDAENEQFSTEKRLSSVSKGGNPFGEKMSLSDLLFMEDNVLLAAVASLDVSLQQQLLEARESLKQMMKTKETAGDGKPADASEQEISGLITTRQRVNQLELENEELRMTIAHQRYKRHPGNPATAPPPPPIAPPLFVCPSQDDVEVLRAENSRLRTELLQYQQRECEEEASGATSYSSVEEEDAEEVTVEVEEEEVSSVADETTTASSHGKCVSDVPQPVPIDVTLLQRNLSQERQRADMWRRLYLSQHDSDKQGSDMHTINATACLHYLVQHMNASALIDYMPRWNISGSGMEDFANLTYLLSSISELQQNLMQSLPSLWNQLSATFHDIRSDFVSDDDEVFDESPGASDEEPMQEEGEGEKTTSENQKQRKWSDGVKNLLNKTRATMSNVSRHLQQTWGKVKEASQRLWPSGDSMISRMAAHVTEGVSKISRKLQKKASGWFNKSSRRDKHSSGKAGQHSDFQDDDFESLKHRKGKKDWKDAERPKHEKPRKDGKVPLRHTHQDIHKQPLGAAEKEARFHADHKHQRAQANKTKVKDDRKQQGKDGKVPDKHTLHGQSQAGPHRPPKTAKEHVRHHTEARRHDFRNGKSAVEIDKKMVKRFQKLEMKVRFMDKQKVMRMDDDDVEDMIEDLHKLYVYRQGVERRTEVDGMWLECQLAFWRDFIGQKDEFSGDCVFYLYDWQTELSPHNHWTPPNQANTSPKGKREDEEHREKESERSKWDGDGREWSPKYNSSDKDQEWFFKWAQGRNKQRRDEHRADWVFDRATDRDTARQSEHSADWLFKRAAERDAERHDNQGAEWMFDRADLRNKARQGRDQHENKDKGHFKGHENSYRQKYGKASCGFG